MAESKNTVLTILKGLQERILTECWEEVKMDLDNVPDELNDIFKANLEDLNGFPNIRGTFGHPPVPRENAKKYLEKWANRYLHAKRPSEHKGEKPKSPYDAVMYEIFSYFEAIGAPNIDEIRRNHEMAMQSEILVGQLLEEYIDSVISKYGWIWCKGDCMRATDFYYPDKKMRLQIKNKYNSENSSSNKIRQGTGIKEWHRLTNQRIPGSDAAKSNWDELRKIVFEEAGITPNEGDDLSEDGFKSFVEKACQSNKNLVLF